MSGELTHSYSIFIRATPEQVWEALTASEFTTQYFPFGRVKSDWQPGSTYTMTRADGPVMYEGDVLESDPPRRLAQSVTFRTPVEFAGHKELRISWDIEQLGEACRLTISHVGSQADAKLFDVLTGSCPDLMSGLKTLLETGTALRIEQPVASAASA